MLRARRSLARARGRTKRAAGAPQVGMRVSLVANNHRPDGAAVRGPTPAAHPS
eukprot:COSAG02_NODE_50954_length_317_cov_0.844037_1_plen_52_part_10